MRNDDLEPMDDELVALLRRGAPTLDASSDARARVFERVAASVGTTLPIASASATKPALATKLVIPIAAFLVGGVAGALLRPRPAPEVRVVYVERSAPSAIPSFAGASAVISPPSSVVTAASAPPKIASASASSLHSPNGMNAERAMLDEARTAFTKGDAAGCLRTLDLHRDRFPAGVLVEEREALAIRALSSLSRHAEASARADRFRANYPTSVMLPAVEAAVESNQ